MQFEIEVLSQVLVDLVGLEGVSLVLNPGGFTVQFVASSEGFTSSFNVGLGIRLSPALLRPYRRVGGGENNITFEPDTNREYTQINLASVSVEIDNAGSVNLHPVEGVQLIDPVMIGDTGMIVESADIELNLSGTVTDHQGYQITGKA